MAVGCSGLSVGTISYTGRILCHFLSDFLAYHLTFTSPNKGSQKLGKGQKIMCRPLNLTKSLEYLFLGVSLCKDTVCICLWGSLGTSFVHDHAGGAVWVGFLLDSLLWDLRYQSAVPWEGRRLSWEEQMLFPEQPLTLSLAGLLQGTLGAVHLETLRIVSVDTISHCSHWVLCIYL